MAIDWSLTWIISARAASDSFVFVGSPTLAAVTGGVCSNLESFNLMSRVRPYGACSWCVTMIPPAPAVGYTLLFVPYGTGTTVWCGCLLLKSIFDSSALHLPAQFSYKAVDKCGAS